MATGNGTAVPQRLDQHTASHPDVLGCRERSSLRTLLTYCRSRTAERRV